MSFAASLPAGVNPSAFRPATAPAPAARSANGLCIFDIDGTLTRQRNASETSCGAPGQPLAWAPECTDCVGKFPPERRALVGNHSYPAPYALGAIQSCLANNYAVGIATARPCHGATVKSRLEWLSKLGAPSDLVGPNATHGPNFMCASTSSPENVTKKYVGIRQLMDKYNVPAQRTVFYDDSQIALDHAKAAIPGLKTQLVSSACKGKWCAEGCGITKGEFDQGFEKTMSGPKS